MQNLKVKTLVLILLGLVVVGGLGYGGYLVFKKVNPQTTPNNTPSSNENTNQSTISAIVRLDNGWSRYENKQFGFSFKYPDSFDIKEFEKNISLEWPGGTKFCPHKETCVYNPKEGVDPDQVSLSIYQPRLYEPNQSVQDYFDSLENERPLTISGRIDKISWIDINGVNSFKFAYENDYFCGIMIPNHNKDYAFDVSASSCENYNDPIVQRIINSVKFEN